MFCFKKYIAWLLLLVFAQVMIPEVAVLAWHSHEHTVDAQKKSDVGFKLDKKHTHCHTDDLFNASFAPSPAATIKPILVLFTDSYSVNNLSVWKFTFPNNIDLRGPPVA